MDEFGQVFAEDINDFSAVPGGPDMISVVSSNIDSVGYDENEFTLYVRFNDKGRGSWLYRYFAVPPSVFEELMNAQSFGQYFYYNIRDSYNYDRLE